jgi:hypothetical protein
MTTVFWDASTPSGSPLKVSRRFGGIYLLQIQVTTSQATQHCIPLSLLSSLSRPQQPHILHIWDFFFTLMHSILSYKQFLTR